MTVRYGAIPIVILILSLMLPLGGIEKGQQSVTPQSCRKARTPLQRSQEYHKGGGGKKYSSFWLVWKGVLYLTGALLILGLAYITYCEWKKWLVLKKKFDCGEKNFRNSYVAFNDKVTTQEKSEEGLTSVPDTKELHKAGNNFGKLHNDYKSSQYKFQCYTFVLFLTILFCVEMRRKYDR